MGIVAPKERDRSRGETLVGSSGLSLYFGPDRHLIELATPAVAVYENSSSGGRPDARLSQASTSCRHVA